LLLRTGAQRSLDDRRKVASLFYTAQTSEITGKIQALRTAADANDLAQVEASTAALRTTFASMGWRGQ